MPGPVLLLRLSAKLWNHVMFFSPNDWKHISQLMMMMMATPRATAHKGCVYVQSGSIINRVGVWGVRSELNFIEFTKASLSTRSNPHSLDQTHSSSVHSHAGYERPAAVESIPSESTTSEHNEVVKLRKHYRPQPATHTRAPCTWPRR